MKMDSIKRRRGKFDVSMCIIEDSLTKFHPEVWRNFVIVDARANYLTGSVEYSAYSPLFDEVPYMMVPPRYNIIISRKVCPETGAESFEVSAVKTDDS